MILVNVSIKITISHYELIWVWSHSSAGDAIWPSGVVSIGPTITDKCAPQKSSLPLFTSDTSPDMHLCPHGLDCIEKATRALNIINALLTGILVAIYKAIVYPILNYTARIWLNQVPFFHLDKYEVIQKKARSPPKGHGIVPQIRDSGSLLEGAPVTVFAALLNQHPPTQSPHHHPHPLPTPDPRILKETLKVSYHWSLKAKGNDPTTNTVIFCGILGDCFYPQAGRLL